MELADPHLAKDLTQLAMFGSNAVLDSQEGARPHVSGGRLVLEAQSAAVSIDQLGTTRLTNPAIPPDRTGHLPAVLEEDLAEALSRNLRFVGEVLDHVDGRGRITAVVPVVGLVLGGAGFRTRAEHQASPNSMSMPRTMGLVTARLTPASRPRPALLHDTNAMVEDMVVLLRDAVHGG
jgi:hypothetical protein